ncbi:MAG: FadR family transcriptional regulator [Rhodobacteraceae bacterium]|nr:FadR family transcriptional regulator [Paracoccaceae bacterium]
MDEKVSRPVTPKTRKLADALFAGILEGVHSYGTRLPAERILCEDYRLSRNTVRQALDLLCHYNVLERQAGSGTVVCYRPPDNSKDTTPEPPIKQSILDLTEIGETTSPLELGVVRSIIEPEMARLAVLSMTSRDIQRLNEIQYDTEQITVDGERFLELDDALRMQIAVGTRNPLIIAIYSMINHVNRTADWAIQRRKSFTPGRIREYRLHNKSLCRAITNRETEATGEYLKLALAEFHQDLLSGF